MNKITIITFLIVSIVTVFTKCNNLELNKFFAIIFIFSVSFILLYSVNDFIAEIIEKIKNNTQTDNQTNEDNNAQLIGFLERILYFIGIVFQNTTLVTIVMALKTISRYKEINRKIKAEYFLIGSFLSLLCAILISAIFIAFDNIHNLGIVNYVVSLITYNLRIIN